MANCSCHDGLLPITVTAISIHVTRILVRRFEPVHHGSCHCQVCWWVSLPHHVHVMPSPGNQTCLSCSRIHVDHAKPRQLTEVLCCIRLSVFSIQQIKWSVIWFSTLCYLWTTHPSSKQQRNIDQLLSSSSQKSLVYPVRLRVWEHESLVNWQAGGIRLNYQVSISPRHVHPCDVAVDECTRNTHCQASWLCSCESVTDTTMNLVGDSDGRAWCTSASRAGGGCWGQLVTSYKFSEMVVQLIICDCIVSITIMAW
jgi:hypothetical protein